MRRTVVLFTLALALLFTSCGQPAVSPTPTPELLTVAGDDQFAQFEDDLEDLRQQLRIPGLSVAIVKGQELVWAAGFGYADLEKQVEATPDTPYGLASVTKPFAAILLMKLVEDGSLNLDTPITNFGIDLGGDGIITLRHLLSHTSEGVPGSRYQYSGNRYAYLSTVIQQLYGATFRRVLRQEILDPLAMSDTALNYGQCGLEYYLSTLGPDDRERAFEHVYRKMATAYQYDPDYEVYPVPNPSYANAGAGLISTVVDLARFAVALDRDELVSRETKELMMTPTRLNSGDYGPYGLGWFTETYGETKLVWHYGYGAYSTLFLRVPNEGLTFIALANTQNLSRPFRLGSADASVLESPFALAFFKKFMLQPRFEEPLPEIDWAADIDSVVDQLAKITDPELRDLYEGELWTYRQLYAGVGRNDVASRLALIHTRAFPDLDQSARDRYQVGRPGPRPTEVSRIRLSEEEQARWIGRYTLRGASTEMELPLEVEMVAYGGRLMILPSEDECAEFLPQTAFRLASSENQALFLVAEDAEGRFATVAVEYGGEVMGTYDRSD